MSAIRMCLGEELWTMFVPIEERPKYVAMVDEDSGKIFNPTTFQLDNGIVVPIEEMGDGGTYTSEKEDVGTLQFIGSGQQFIPAAFINEFLSLSDINLSRYNCKFQDVRLRDLRVSAPYNASLSDCSCIKEVRGFISFPRSVRSASHSIWRSAPEVLCIAPITYGYTGCLEPKLKYDMSILRVDKCIRSDSVRYVVMHNRRDPEDILRALSKYPNTRYLNAGRITNTIKWYQLVATDKLKLGSVEVLVVDTEVGNDIRQLLVEGFYAIGGTCRFVMSSGDNQSWIGPLGEPAYSTNLRIFRGETTT